MTRGEFRHALDNAHHGIIETDQGDGEALGALLDQIAAKAPDRDPALDAAARRAYNDQAKTGIPVTDVDDRTAQTMSGWISEAKSGVRVTDLGLSVDQELALDMVANGALSEADALAVMTGTKTITGDILTPTLRDTRPKTTRKRS